MVDTLTMASIAWSGHKFYAFLLALSSFVLESKIRTHYGMWSSAFFAYPLNVLQTRFKFCSKQLISDCQVSTLAFRQSPHSI